jgi:hypothetical protein
LPTLYLIVDAVLGGLFALALWPIVRMRRWEGRLRQKRQTEQLRLGWVVVRLGWDFGAPLILLLGARLLLHMLGAQSWAEGLSLFPDVGAWLWAIALLMLLTGATRLLLLCRVLRRTDRQETIAAPTGSTSQRPA